MNITIDTYRRRPTDKCSCGHKRSDHAKAKGRDGDYLSCFVCLCESFLSEKIDAILKEQQLTTEEK